MKGKLSYWLLLLASWCSSSLADYAFEHSLDGRSFEHAGVVTDSLEFDRAAPTSSEVNSLYELAKADGFYSTRIDVGSNRHVVSSVRARCLFSEESKHELQLTLDVDGNILSFSYRAPASPACDVAPVPKANFKFPPTTVRAYAPAPGAEVKTQDADVAANIAKTVLTAEGGGAAVGAAPGFIGGGKSSGSLQTQTPGAQGKAGGPPAKDERTWLQKNWLFAVAIGMMVLNIVGRLGADPAGGAAAATGAAAGPPAAGGGAARAGPATGRARRG